MIGLAPMEGVTDFPFRRWLSLCSKADFHSTPFLRVTHTFPINNIPEDFAPELTDPIYKEKLNTPLVLQVMGPSPDRIVETGKLIHKYTNSFDINFGCPAPTVVGRGSGSALLQDAKEFKNFLSQVHEKLPNNSFSIKIRTGYENTENFEKIIEAIKPLELTRLTIHGRTKVQKYSGLADWSLIEQAARTLNFPVFGSGDIQNFNSYNERLNTAPSVSGVIIGRAVQKNPWIFSTIRNDKNISLSLKTILYASITYGLFIQIFYGEGFKKFKETDIANGIIESALSSESNWKDYLCSFAKSALGTDDIYNLPIERRALSRIKMIWTHLKDSMPENFNDRALLRAATINDFIKTFENKESEYIKETGSNQILF